LAHPGQDRRGTLTSASGVCPLRARYQACAGPPRRFVYPVHCLEEFARDTGLSHTLRDLHDRGERLADRIARRQDSFPDPRPAGAQVSEGSRLVHSGFRHALRSCKSIGSTARPRWANPVHTSCLTLMFWLFTQSATAAAVRGLTVRLICGLRAGRLE
jgi:hypothetical protein